MLKPDWWNNEIAASLTLAPVNSASTTDHNCTAVDGRGCESVVHVVAVGNSGDTLSGSVKIELELEESDDNSSWDDCEDADLRNPDTGASAAVTGTNPGTFAVIDDGTEDTTLFAVRYVGGRRYSRVVVNKTGTHTNGTPVAVLGFRARPTTLPL